MKYNHAILKGTLLIAGCLAGPFGCSKDDSDDGAPNVFNLRVVMFVETGADLNDPLPDTGGCKLTRTQVTTLVDELVAFGGSVSPGVTFNWDRTIHKLESDCLHLLPPPFRLCMSPCSLTGVPDNCPRLADVWSWFSTNVVNQAAGGVAMLQQDDMYVNDNCTLNLYFVGNVILSGGFGAGWTFIPGLVPSGTPHFIAVNDLAFEVPTAPAQFGELRNRRVLAHEAACHFVLGVSGHPNPPLGVCPRNLCVSGTTFDDCSQQYGGRQPSDLPQLVQDAIVARLQGFFQCGD